MCVYVALFFHESCGTKILKSDDESQNLSPQAHVLSQTMAASFFFGVTGLVVSRVVSAGRSPKTLPADENMNGNHKNVTYLRIPFRSLC